GHIRAAFPGSKIPAGLAPNVDPGSWAASPHELREYLVSYRNTVIDWIVLVRQDDDPDLLFRNEGDICPEAISRTGLIDQNIVARLHRRRNWCDGCRFYDHLVRVAFQQRL